MLYSEVWSNCCSFEFSPGLGILLLGVWGKVAQFKRQVKNSNPLEVGPLTNRDE